MVGIDDQTSILSGYNYVATEALSHPQTSNTEIDTKYMVILLFFIVLFYLF